MRRRRPKLGLALGSGSARGWSHIGVLRALQRAGHTPDIVCGSSIGALVGAVYAADRLDWLEEWTRALTWQGVLGLLDLRIGGGLIEGTRLVQFFRKHFEDQGIAQLPRRYACVATELASGREVWLREGPVIDAVRASIALPGLFTPALHEGRLLVDGGLVNPVPVSLCRAMGADIVIAVDLNWDLVGRHARAADAAVAAAGTATPGALATLLARFMPARGQGAPAAPADDDAAPPPPTPSMMDVLATSLNIMQVRITQSRLAGEPADVLIRPRLSDIAAMDFHRAELAIAQGEKAAELALDQIADCLG